MYLRICDTLSTSGGILSSILFIRNINDLFDRLHKLHVGCYIGGFIFVGMLMMMGYADDVIILAPSVLSMNMMLSVTSKIGDEFDVKFNPEKNQ